MHPRLYKFLVGPLWLRLLALFSVLLVVALAFCFVFILPQNEKLDRLRGQYKTLEHQYIEKKKIADNLSLYQQEYEILEVRLNKSLNELPKEKEIPSLLTNVANRAKDQGLGVTLFRPKAEVLREFYAEVPVELGLTGDYHDTALFFESVASMSRIVNIVNVDLKLGKGSSSGGDKILSIKCDAVTFRFVDSSNSPNTNNTSAQKRNR